MTNRRTRAGLLLLILVVSATAAAQTIETGDDVIAELRANAQRIEDLDAVIVVETYADGAVDLTQRLRLSILQPNRMRQEYLEPDYLAGNLTLIVGDAMWIYIAAAGTWYSKDLSELSAAEQPWLVFRQFLRDVQDEFDDYAFDLVGDGGESYHLVGTPTTDAAAYGRVELWIDPVTFVPTRRVLFDVDGNLLVDLHILEVEEVAEGTYLARSMETYDEDGELRSTIRYDELTVDSGLDPALFERPAEASDG
jgi:outer membrane lipoprotein-sorting protein